MATYGSATVCESKTACSSGIDSVKADCRAGISPVRTGAGAQADGALHRWSSIGTAAAILLGVSGIAILSACMRASSAGERVVAAALIAGAPPKGEARVIVKCAECGVVDSVRQVEIVGDADAMTGADHDGVLGKSTTSYEVTVRMRDGSDRVFMDANPANWRPGDRVTIIERTVGAEN
jgi:hypothetical protein